MGTKLRAKISLQGTNNFLADFQRRADEEAACHLLNVRNLDVNRSIGCQPISDHGEVLYRIIEMFKRMVEPH